jgi:CheY-like chemotaxis protein
VIASSLLKDSSEDPGCVTELRCAKCSTIIIVEDDEAIRFTVQQVLEMEGYRVAAFANGKEALEGLSQVDGPCLILLDLMMPVMDGWQFLEARRHNRDAIAAIPVVVVSAWADQARNEESVAGFVKKPVDVEVLLRMVTNYCERSAAAA